MRPVLRRLRLADGFDDVAVLLVPLGGRPMERIDHPGGGSLQLEAQQVGEQVVVAEPRAPGVDRRDEGVGVGEARQDGLRRRRPGQVVRERAVDPVEHRRAQQQLAHLGPLTLEDLRHQIRRHGPLTAGELADELVRIGMPGQRERRQAQARGPALRPVAEERHALA